MIQHVTSPYQRHPQIAFFSSFVGNLRGPSNDLLKLVKARGTYFQPRPPNAPRAGGINRLLRQFVVRLAAGCVDVVHWTPDWSGDDPSQGIVVSAGQSSFHTAYLMNQPPLPGQPTPRGRRGCACSCFPFFLALVH